MNSLCKPQRNFTEDESEAGIRALLDHHETSVEPAATSTHGDTCAPTTEAEAEFRHSGWRERRQRTALALGKAGSTPATLHRFHQCGAAAWIMADPADNTRFRIQSERCRSRWCEACGRERRSLIQMNLAKHLPKQRIRFMTLTLKSTDDQPEVCVRRLYACFRKLRQRQKMKSLIRGGIAFLELTYTPERRQFHPHLHIIFEGNYVPHAQLRNEWLSVTGDSFIVDVRQVARPDHAIGYVAKYASKSIGPSIWKDDDAFAAVIRGLKGVRTLFTFGTWRNFKLLDAPQDDTAWQTIGKLETMIQRAKSGDPEACRILNALGRYIPADEHADASLFADDG